MVTPRPTRREAGLIGLAILAVAAGSRSALAHAHLVSASPAVDSTLRKAPREVSVSFTEKLEEKLSLLVVRDSAGRQVDAGDTRLADASGKKIIVGLGDIGPGKYTVSWTAASVDTHRTTGSFSFTVRS